MLERFRRWLGGAATGAAAHADAAPGRNAPAEGASRLVLSELAARHENAGRSHEACAALEGALALSPEDPNLYYRLAGQQMRGGDAEAALDSFNLALHYAPSLYGACVGRVEALRRLGQAEREPEAWREFLRANPAHAAAAYELARWHHGKGELEEAMALLEPLAAAEPVNRDACSLLGLILGREFGRFSESVRLLERSLAPDPDWNVAHCNLALVLSEHGDYEAGLAHIDAVLRQDPDDQEARLTRAYMNLRRGRFAEGWRDYSARHGSPLAIQRPHRFASWDGVPMPGGTLLIYAEQGLGDQIMFSSCIPDALSRAGRCVVECEPRLAALFQRSFPQARVLEQVADGESTRFAQDAGPIDRQIPMGDLPGLFRNSTGAFPRHNGYLRASAARIGAWRERLAPLGPGPKIGISWQGGVRATRRRLRSIPLAEFAPLFSHGAHFVSLQYGECASELNAFRKETGAEIAHWPEAIDDYDETAALVSALDLVISVCTAVVHLAGALGRPVWVLAPVIAEWRYLDRGESLPWYPAARVFRQQRPGAWEPVVAAVEEVFMTWRPSPDHAEN